MSLKKFILHYLKAIFGARHCRRILLICVDFVLLYIAYYVAHGLINNSLDLNRSFLFIVLGKLIVFHLIGLYEFLWRYASITALIRITKAVSLASFLAFLISFWLNIPAAIIVIDWSFSLILVGGFRFSLRLIRDYQNKNNQKKSSATLKKRLIIIGAGDAGEVISREVQRSRNLHFDVIGFLDDKQSKQNKKIHNIPVLGKTKDIVKLAAENHIDEAIIAIPSITSEELRQIISYCDEAAIRYKVTPGLFEIIDGHVSINEVRDVRIEDLLGRDVINTNTSCSEDFRNKTVLITGGGGSIGSELCRQVLRLAPKEVIVLDNSEFSVYEIDMELNNLVQTKELKTIIKTLICDVEDRNRLDYLFSQHSIDYIYHAAAYKHVPLMEKNIEEVVTNNIVGTQNVIEMADKYTCKKFVLVSTDKAVNPTNVMGASKRVCEILMQNQARESKTIYSAVRFGNVLGSKGSVIPLFRKQIQSGGPITVTHPDMTRYFMTISEAVSLVIQASIIAKGGEIFILDMGKPVKIINLAKEMIHLSGLKSDQDIDIIFTGLRPGEKLFEELMLNKEKLESTSNNKIFITQPFSYDKDTIKNCVNELAKLSNTSGNRDVIRHKLFELIDENFLKNVRI
jgi:FlaA1/EpsC-like NDP-sugar epimerase